MGCCPIFGKSNRSQSEYQLMNQQQKKVSNNNNEIDQDCQQIDVQNDDFFDKTEDQQLSTKNPLKKHVSIKDFKTIKIIGRGGFGKVLLVEKKDTGKIYAMKTIKKELISQRNQQVHTRAERKILQNMRCPFIVQLHFAFQSNTRLYLVMDFMIGGELFFHLRKQKKFNEDRARLYAAQMVIALDYLHRKNTIYRDLKPENILIGADGYLKITDFGLSKVVISGEKSYTFCGTPEYLAPQIFLNKGHDFSCDWWSLGALIYQMLSGAPPFYSKDKQKMLQDRLNKNIIMRDYFSQATVSLLRGLLNNNPKERLGKNGAAEIKNHAFFAGLNWDNLYLKKIPMPFKPNINDEKDLNYFDKIFTEQVMKQTPADAIKDEYDGYTFQKNTLRSEISRN